MNRQSNVGVVWFCIGASFVAQSVAADEAAQVVDYYGYEDCIRLRNATTTAVLCPAAGGRILEYSLKGKNVLYLPAGDEGWKATAAKPAGNMNAGRFDIGPEQVVDRGLVLWAGPWEGKITGARNARLTSKVDPKSGVKLIRDFVLADDSSQLTCTQTIVNVSNKPVSLCHWSRTFAVGPGIAIVPRSPRGRFKNGYVMYRDGQLLDMKPVDESIEVTDAEILIKAAPRHPKLGFDSMSGWLGYLAPNDQLFVKRFKTYPNRAYNEVAGLTVSVWYPKNRGMVELEPIGPAENLSPGEQASFSEEWWLFDYPFPRDGSVVPQHVRQFVNDKTGNISSVRTRE